MLYWDSRSVMKSIATIPMPTHRIVRFASSFGDSGGDPTRFC
jgi:hypothetical protein